MELTPENAAAGDRAYLNLLVWQALGSSPTGCLWSAIIGIAVQGVLLGVVGLKAYPLLSSRSGLSKLQFTGVGAGMSLVISVLGVSLSQAYRLVHQNSDYLSIVGADQRESRVVVGLIECAGVGLMVYGAWQIWKMTEKKALIPLLIFIPLMTLGVFIPVLASGTMIPTPTVSKFGIFDTWVKRQAILLRVWTSTMVVGLAMIWSIWVYYSTKLKFEDTRRTVQMVCEAFCPATLMSLVVLIYLCATPGSLNNASQPLIQSLPSLMLFAILQIIIANSEGAIHLPVYSYTSPPPQSYYSRPPSSLVFGFTNSTMEPRTTSQSQKGSVKTSSNHEARSGKGTIQSQGSESLSHVPSLSPPPSAFAYGRAPPSAWAFNQSGFHLHSRSGSGAHSGSQAGSHAGSRKRYTPSQASSAIPTLGFQPDYPDVPLNVITSFTDWLEYDPLYASSDRDSESVKTNVAPSFKSAVPSGKTLYRSRSERMRKAASVIGPGGIVLDHTGWNEVPLPPLRLSGSVEAPATFTVREGQDPNEADRDHRPTIVVADVLGESSGTGVPRQAENTIQEAGKDVEGAKIRDIKQPKDRRQSKSKSKSTSRGSFF